MAIHRLSGRIIRQLQPCLLLEDSSIVLLDLEQTVRALGLTDVQAVTSIPQARHALNTRTMRSAVLDIQIYNAPSVDIAIDLAKCGAAIVFVTGYSTKLTLPPELAHVNVLSKPTDPAMIISALVAALGADCMD